MIVVAGKNNIAVHALEVLSKKLGRTNVLAIPNQDDTGYDSWQRSFRKAANELGVEVTNLDDIKDDTNIKCLISLECDKLLDPNRFPGDAIFNIHFSDLPKYKGMYTSFWPIFNGEKKSGVTLHRIDRGIDTGPVIAKKTFAVASKDRAFDVYSKYIEFGISLFDEQIDYLIAGNFSSKSQSAVNSSYYPKGSVDFSNARISLNVTAWQMKRQVYAYTFRPYQLPLLGGRYVVDVKITSKQSLLKPGQIVADEGDRLVISTVDYDAIIFFDKLDVFLSNMRDMDRSEFMKGLNHIAGVNDRNQHGWSPIIVAAYTGRSEFVRHLVSLGASVNDTNFNGTSVLMYAKDYFLRSGNIEIFSFLLANGADVNKKDYHGNKLIDYLSPSELKLFEGYL